MAQIISPMSGSDGLILTPAQRQEQEQEEIKIFLEELKALENKHGMGLRFTMMYTPNGIFPNAKIVKLKPDSNLMKSEEPEKEGGEDKDKTKT